MWTTTTRDGRAPSLKWPQVCTDHLHPASDYGECQVLTHSSQFLIPNHTPGDTEVSAQTQLLTWQVAR